MAKSLLVNKVQERALAATPEEVACFPWTHEDVLIAEAMLAGIKSVQDIAAEVGLQPSTLRHRLLDPVRCAWISGQIERSVESRLGQVLGAVYARAVATGDPRSAEMLLRHFGKLKPDRRESLNVTVGLDLSSLSPDELQKLVDQKMRKLGLKQDEEHRDD